MRHPEGGGWRCSYGTWHGIDEHCRCAPRALALAPVAADPAALPVIRAGTTYRFHVVDHTLLILRAVLEHEAATLTGVAA